MLTVKTNGPPDIAAGVFHIRCCLYQAFLLICLVNMLEKKVDSFINNETFRGERDRGIISGTKVIFSTSTIKVKTPSKMFL